MTKKTALYGSDVTWGADEIEAFKTFNRMCREQALAIFAWDAASVRGQAIGDRPASQPALELAAIARGQA